MKSLFIDSCASNADFHTLEVNRKFATRYKHRKEREELQKLKDKYGHESVCDTDESDLSEDDQKLNAELDMQFVQTLAMLKSKRGGIEHTQVLELQRELSSRIASDVSGGNEGTENKMASTVYLKDFERYKLQHAEKSKEASSSFSVMKGVIPREGDQKIKASILQKTNECLENKGDFLIKRSATSENSNSENGTLITDSKNVMNSSISLDILKKAWSAKNLSKEDRFLRDYVLNNSHTNSSHSARVPRYDEIVNANESEAKLLVTTHRFQESGHDEIITHSRNQTESVRLQDCKRKRLRDRKKQRQNQIKLSKRQELERLKSLRHKQMVEMIKKLEEISGTDTFHRNFLHSSQLFDEDFDPSSHDQMMMKIFDTEYYNQTENQRPIAGYSIAGEDSVDPIYEDFDDGLNCDEWGIPGGETYEKDCESTRTMSKRAEKLLNRRMKRKNCNRNSHLKIDDDSVLNLTEEQKKQINDRLYRMNYEDLIAGEIPVRFNYRHITPRDFGLTADQILLCSDSELKRWCPVKKLVCYSDSEDLYRYQKMCEKRARNHKILKKFLPSLSNLGENGSKFGTIKENIQDEITAVQESVTPRITRKKLSKKFFRMSEKKNLSKVSTLRLISYGLQDKCTMQTKKTRENI